MMLLQLERALQDLAAKSSPTDAALLGALLARIVAWKRDDTVPVRLMSDLESIIAQSWTSTGPLRADVHKLLDAFRETVGTLGGMTMNERLCMFDLFDAWDAANETGREALSAKLEARR